MAKRKTRNPDHVRRKNVPGPDNEVIEAQLTDLISPAVANQQAYYRQLGLRSRILNLPLMVAAAGWAFPLRLHSCRWGMKSL